MQAPAGGRRRRHAGGSALGPKESSVHVSGAAKRARRVLRLLELQSAGEDGRASGGGRGLHMDTRAVSTAPCMSAPAVPADLPHPPALFPPCRPSHCAHLVANVDLGQGDVVLAAADDLGLVEAAGAADPAHLRQGKGAGGWQGRGGGPALLWRCKDWKQALAAARHTNKRPVHIPRRTLTIPPAPPHPPAPFASALTLPVQVEAEWYLWVQEPGVLYSTSWAGVHTICGRRGGGAQAERDMAVEGTAGQAGHQA